MMCLAVPPRLMRAWIRTHFTEYNSSAPGTGLLARGLHSIAPFTLAAPGRVRGAPTHWVSTYPQLSGLRSASTTPHQRFIYSVSGLRTSVSQAR